MGTGDGDPGRSRGTPRGWRTAPSLWFSPRRSDPSRERGPGNKAEERSGEQAQMAGHLDGRTTPTVAEPSARVLTGTAWGVLEEAVPRDSLSRHERRAFRGGARALPGRAGRPDRGSIRDGERAGQPGQEGWSRSPFSESVTPGISFMVAFSDMPKLPDYSELSDSLTLAVGTGRFSGPLHRAWRMMNFRQRMGWIGVGLYLLASAAAFYYVFEINETYNRLALEHVQQHAEEPREGASWTHSLKARLLSLPFWFWTIIFLIPYLQMFLFLYSCTRADPKTVGYCIIPICLAVICNRHQAFVKASNQISRLQLIDT